MPQSREEKNRKARERYKKMKEANFTRNQIRSTAKTVKQEPGLMDALKTVYKEGARIFNNIMGDAPAPKKSTPKKSKPTKTITSKKTGKRIPTFENFVKKMIGENPNISKNKLRKEYRDIGGTISNQGGNKVISETRAKPENRQYSIIKHKGRSKARKKFIKDRFQYLVRYQVDVDGFLEPETRYLTIATDEPFYDEQEIVDYVGGYLIDNEGEEISQRGKKEYYTVKGLTPDSIRLIDAFDMEKR